MIHFDIASKEESLKEVNSLLTDSSVWDDIERSTALMKKQKTLQNAIHEYKSLVEKCEELEFACELYLEVQEEGEESKAAMLEIRTSMDELNHKRNKLKLKSLLSGEYDENNAIISIHAGSGGVDAMDWASMLYRMYLRWCEQNDYSVEILDYQADDVAGIKSATLKVNGEYAYGYLKSEKGVHRIVRISPFDSSGRRHTSFSAVDVLPELADDEEIEIDDKDLRIDTYRASGAGGQHVNKTSSAVRITHLPTGVVTQCQNERSQLQNKNTAMKMLMAKLIHIQKEQHKEKIEDIQGDFSQITWGSQIRSYVFQPYQMVKDHRTGAEVAQVDDVMDGELEVFMNAYLANQE